MSTNHTFFGYKTEGFYDELFDAEGKPRAGGELLVDCVNSLPLGVLGERQEAIERALHRMGITFAVYGDTSGNEKIFPFDIVPRIVEAVEWARIEAGLKQLDQRRYRSASLAQQGNFIPRSMPRFVSAEGYLVSRHRDRLDPPQRRRDLCARRQPTMPVGRFLRAAESLADEANFPATFCRFEYSASHRLSD
jgi:hypothetical protein